VNKGLEDNLEIIKKGKFYRVINKVTDKLYGTHRTITDAKRQRLALIEGRSLKKKGNRQQNTNKTTINNSGK
jgi:ribosomal protein S4E